MDLLSSKIENLFSSFVEKEGPLPVRYDPVLNDLRNSLVNVKGQTLCPPKAAASIHEGLQSVQQTIKELDDLERQGEEGNWLYEIFGFPKLSRTLVLKHDRPEGTCFYFQVDSTGQVGGIFNMVFENNGEDEQIVSYSFEKRSDGWYLVQMDANKTSCRIELTPGHELNWGSSAAKDIFSHLYPAEGVGITELFKFMIADNQNKEQPVLPVAPPVKTQSNFCANCGAPLAPNIRFCGQCAAPVPVQTEQTPAPQAPPPAAVVPVPMAPPPAPTPAPKAPTWCLVVTPGGQNIALTDRLAIGRTADNDLRLEDPQLSRHHAVIEQTAGGWQVSDLGSKNGTAVNGKRISTPLVLKAGDVIELGDIRLTLELH